MKTNPKRAYIVVLLALLLATFSLAGSSAVFAASCNVTIIGENGGNNAIQNAINNAEALVTGPKICIAGGTYPEQLTITSSSIQLIGLGNSLNPTLIQPTSVTQNSYDFAHGLPADAIIAVDGSSSTAPGISGDKISNIVVDGSMVVSSMTGCSPAFFGIYYVDASGSITGSTAENIYLGTGTSLLGCQTGLTIFADTQATYTSTMTIKNDHAINYQKNGITCRDAGTSCTITMNTVSFYSTAAPYIASNGIEVAFGAKAVVTQNTVSGNVCTLAGACGSDLINQAQGTGILTYLSAAGTSVSSNTLTGNDLGVGSYADAASVVVKSNTISASTFAAILQYDGTYTASKNTLSGTSIGVVAISDGTGADTVSHITSNTFNGFAERVQILTAIPGTATVTFNGTTFLVSGNALVDIV